MTKTFSPSSADEICSIVAEAGSARIPLEVAGNGTRRGIGRLMETKYCLTTSALSGLLLYEPEELVVRVGPGMTIANLKAHLDQNSQMLAFEPPDLGPLLGAEPEQGTIGGIIAGNFSGPRRIKAGAARDHFLGVEAVSGRGEIFKSGGRVVKNVTGYDLCKLLAGSWGTLGIMTEITLKVLPAPESTRTILVACDNSPEAVLVLTNALASPHDISGAAWVPKTAAARSSVNYVSDIGAGIAAIRIEGFRSSTGARCDALNKLVAEFGQTEELHTHNSAVFWEEVQNVRLFPPIESRDAVWRISVAPSASAVLVEKLRAEMELEALLDWGGGLIWLYVKGSPDAGSSVIRTLVGSISGHATLISGSDKTRNLHPVFQPQSDPIQKLTRKLKTAFDPLSILNPGRMFEGI